MGSGTIIEATGLTRSFGGLVAIEDYRLRLAEDDLVGLIGPRAVPSPIISRINADAVKYLKTEEVRTRYQQGGADSAPSTPGEFRQLMLDEQARVKKIVQEIGLKPQF